jgi:DNA-binding transcriptional regulator YiaG
VKTADVPKKRRATKGTAAGREIISALRELAEVLESGQPERSRFTVRTVQLPDEPRRYTPAAVRATRARLKASQAIFASLMGVSTVLVQHWEAGSRVPAMWARRLLDEVNRDPGHWQAMTRPPSRAGSAA